MKKVYNKMEAQIHSCDVKELGMCGEDVSDEELKNKLEVCGYPVKKRLITNKNYIMREIAGAPLLISVGQEIADFCGIINLNESARILWEALEKGATREELVEKLKGAYDISTERASQDVDSTLKNLLERGMIAYV
ncbi:MAG: PqqD family protein [Firmicutes bacterium]|nr:PqqD family protein [Bacillota bacterium]